MTLAIVPHQLPYRYAVWVEHLRPVHVIFEANAIVRLTYSSEEDWYLEFRRKLDQEFELQPASENMGIGLSDVEHACVTAN